MGDIDHLFEGDCWTIEEFEHQAITVFRTGRNRYRFEAWAENWDDMWTWSTDLTASEVAALAADPERPRALLLESRKWTVTPPSSVPRSKYTKQGQLDGSDGFQDGGRGGKG